MYVKLIQEKDFIKLLQLLVVEIVRRGRGKDRYGSQREGILNVIRGYIFQDRSFRESFDLDREQHTHWIVETKYGNVAAH